MDKKCEAPLEILIDHKKYLRKLRESRPIEEKGEASLVLTLVEEHSLVEA